MTATPPPTHASPSPPHAGLLHRYVLPLLVTAAFLAITAPLVLHHAMWRDEADPFVLARDSPSLLSLLAGTRYEGHPPLWYVLLWTLTRVTVVPLAAQWLNLALAALTVFLFTRFAPFPLIARILLPFGYYVLFEYAVIARNYQVMILLAVLFCIAWRYRPRNFVLLGTLIALLCATHVFGVIMATGFGAALLVEYLGTSEARAYIRGHLAAFFAGVLIAAGGAALCTALVIQPSDSGWLPDWRLDLIPAHVGRTVTALGDAYFPLPVDGVHFWNAQVLPDWAAGILGVLALVVSILAVAASPQALAFLAMTDGGLLLFLHTKYYGAWRHHGILFIAFLIAVWIRRDRVPVPMIRLPRWLSSWRFAGVTVTLAVVVQIYGSVIACWFAIQHPFSESERAAAFLSARLRSETVVVARSDVGMASLAAYLPGRKFFYPRGSRWGTFTDWRATFSRKDPMTWAKIFAAEKGEPVILLWDEPIPQVGGQLRYLGGFEGGIVADERFYIYEVAPSGSASTKQAQ